MLLCWLGFVCVWGGMCVCSLDLYYRVRAGEINQARRDGWEVGRVRVVEEVLILIVSFCANRRGCVWWMSHNEWSAMDMRWPDIVNPGGSMCHRDKWCVGRGGYWMKCGE